MIVDYNLFLLVIGLAIFVIGIVIMAITESIIAFGVMIFGVIFLLYRMMKLFNVFKKSLNR